MQIRILIPLLVISGVLVGVTALWAQHSAGKRPVEATTVAYGQGQGWCSPMADWKTGMALTDEQAQQVAEVQAQSWKAATPYWQIMQEKEQAITDAMRATQPDQATINRLIEEEGQATIKYRQALAAGRIRLRNLLPNTQYCRMPVGMACDWGWGMGYGPSVHNHQGVAGTASALKAQPYQETPPTQGQPAPAANDYHRGWGGCCRY